MMIRTSVHHGYVFVYECVLVCVVDLLLCWCLWLGLFRRTHDGNYDQRGGFPMQPSTNFLSLVIFCGKR
jgi:hypothetical protein